MDLSIIIVNYRTFELTRNTIESVLNSSLSCDYEIIVVDNASGDGSLEKLEDFFADESRVRFIQSSVNGGFAYANNLAIRDSNPGYYLLLNSDTIVEDNTLTEALNYIQSHDDVGALGVRVCLEDGKLDKACRRSFPNPTNSFYRLFHIPSHNNSNDDYNLDNLDDSGIYEIDCLTGAFILMRSKVMDEIGLLDETFFMYGEDIDLCYRIKKAGYKIVYYGKVKITHLKGASSKKQKNKLIYEFYRAMYIFYHKHYRDRYSPLLNGLVYIGIALLLIVHLILNLFKKSN